MTVCSCILWPDKCLSNRALSAAAITYKVYRRCADVIETMQAVPGVGLAATQIGVPLRFAVVDASEVRGQVIWMANPEILHASREPRADHGASPNLLEAWASIKQTRAVIVQFLDAVGKCEQCDLVRFWAILAQQSVDFQKRQVCSKNN